ncbi:uncharacterized protein LOC108605343 [Drosophila busckii]|uniref:uncharacterized protein LOC108605343 n=1 Tax=Drosophila busckii TaxID=30019 RepID=UPI00083F4991|nr:uncharacterized protein LOC108605343 [Drosophila busckii]
MNNNSMKIGNPKPLPAVGSMGSDYLSQTAYMHSIRKSATARKERKYYESLAHLRKTDGMAGPLRIMMDRYSVRQAGRLAFLNTNQFSDEVLTGRIYEVAIEDVYNIPHHSERQHEPHSVMEMIMGIHI